MMGIHVTGRAALAILTISFVIVPASAQKVQVSADKSANFSQYKRYAWSKNYPLTRQTPDDQKAIGDALKNSINRQLLAKGYILDDKNPDFSVSYEAGGMSKADISTTPDLSRDIGNPNSMNQPADIGPPMTRPMRGFPFSAACGLP